MLKNRIEETARLTPGAEMFLQDLKMRNKKLALASSTIFRFVSLMLSHFKLETLFDVILTAESIKKGKPDPEIYLKALEQIKLPAANCLVFEDSDAGIKAASAAKIICIKVYHYDNGFSK
ncbi:HAD-IA family hydrolase [Candidatus Parcubacteria bacterium]|nr:HAD-IA family hydrolase [Patescibacteria group bacterium]MBU4466924.1 HAD-IA family hydrolase [Patescibacteria group bacterium]MCG2688485.1 HAD-IA family hydrolase [Candidatus Parcubacteria bacterium]